MDSSPTYIDLFSGCGGLSHGFSQAGFRPIAAVDNWLDALQTYSFNHRSAEVIEMDLSSEQPTFPLEKFRGIDLVIGGPPCQGFSISGKRNPEDERNNLYKGFLKVVKNLKPRFFLMENVPNLKGMSNGQIYKRIFCDFEEIGYSLTGSVLLASDFGVPQNRKRCFIVGQPKSFSKNPFLFPEGGTALHKIVTSSEAISDLTCDSLADGSEYPVEPKTKFQRMMRQQSSGVWNHQICQHTEKTKSIISLVPDGGNYKDLPKEFQETRKVNIAWTRLDSKKPSFTIDTGHRHHFHYKWNRVPTVREAARLQSFPDHFVFLGNRTSQMRQVGNAVPPLLAKILAKAIKAHL